MSREWTFSRRSLDKLQGVHPDLVKVMVLAIKESPYDFGVTSGLRTEVEQRKLVAEGKSKTMNSKHLDGEAVDIAVYYRGQLTWEFHYYKEVARHIKIIARELNVDITWGGEWKTFKDGPHYQINSTTNSHG